MLVNQGYSVYSVSEDHCFMRVVLDWLCKDRWDKHLSKPAYKNLNEEQLLECIEHLKLYLDYPCVFEEDNKKSKEHRK